MTVLRLTAINWFQLTWVDDPTGEVWGWDVDRALEIAATKTPEPISVRQIAYLTEVYEVDREYALSSCVDVTKPLLIVLVEGRETASLEVKATGIQSCNHPQLRDLGSELFLIGPLRSHPQGYGTGLVPGCGWAVEFLRRVSSQHG